MTLGDLFGRLRIALPNAEPKGSRDQQGDQWRNHFAPVRNRPGNPGTRHEHRECSEDADQ